MESVITRVVVNDGSESEWDDARSSILSHV
jgi:hypothetical protein